MSRKGQGTGSNDRSPLDRLPLRRGFTLIEMFTTVAVLIIVLGLMVSLARNVRDRSAQQFTRELLRQLAVLMDEYAARNDRQLPAVDSIIPLQTVDKPEESQVASLAERNNKQFVAALRRELSKLVRGSRGGTDSLLGQAPLSVYDETSLRDAWGSPIVFMQSQNYWIGLAPKARRGQTSFFFSAGPDRQYLTRDDNLYSYETSVAEPE